MLVPIFFGDPLLHLHCSKLINITTWSPPARCRSCRPRRRRRRPSPPACGGDCLPVAVRIRTANSHRGFALRIRTATVRIRSANFRKIHSAKCELRIRSATVRMRIFAVRKSRTANFRSAIRCDSQNSQVRIRSANSCRGGCANWSHHDVEECIMITGGACCRFSDFLRSPRSHNLADSGRF